MASLAASPGSVVNGDTGIGPGWTNPGNATADDGSYATVTLDMGEFSETLDATNFDFSAIPNTATVDGLAVKVRAFRVGDECGFDGCKFYKATGTTWHTATNDFSVNIGLTEGSHTAGGATELCGTTWSVSADIKDSGFGVRFSAVALDALPATISVDYVEVTVYYTPAGGTAVQNKVASFSQAIHRASSY